MSLDVSCDSKAWMVEDQYCGGPVGCMLLAFCLSFKALCFVVCCCSKA